MNKLDCNDYGGDIVHQIQKEGVIFREDITQKLRNMNKGSKDSYNKKDCKGHFQV